VLFESGSALCGAAPSMNVMIVGRAIAGLGVSLNFSALITLLIHLGIWNVSGVFDAPLSYYITSPKT
jgi:MFS family permease